MVFLTLGVMDEGIPEEARMAGVQHHRTFHQFTAALPVAAVGRPERDLTDDGAVQGLSAKAPLRRSST